MQSTQGFVDLRITPQSQGSHSDDSVWPSFTDIMTVVVMIFLMALVVIMIRNFDLVQQLRTTMEAEREAADIARSTAVQKVELEERLDEMERRIAEMQLRLRTITQERDTSQEALAQSEEKATSLMADIVALQALRNKLLEENEELALAKLQLSGRLKVVEEEKTQLETEKQTVESQKVTLESEKQSLLAQLEALGLEKTRLESEKSAAEQELADISAAKSATEAQLATQTEEKTQLSSEFDALKAVYSLLQQDQRSLEDRYTAAQAALENLEQQYKEKELELAVEQEKVQQGEQQIETLTSEVSEISEELTELEEKYLKLVGPARSKLDKYVVEIRYRKVGQGHSIEMREPGQANFQLVTPDFMNTRLAELKAQNPKNLYTSIIIPDDSGLSYNEAWKFTQDILQRYDYYYQ